MINAIISGIWALFILWVAGWGLVCFLSFDWVHPFAFVSNWPDYHPIQRLGFGIGAFIVFGMVYGVFDDELKANKKGGS